VADGAVAVVAALVDGRGQFEKTPEEIEGFGWRGWRDMFDDGAALHVEIRRERAHLVPVHKGARLGDGGKPFADFRCDIATIAAACQFKAQQALGGSIAGHQFQQQIGQPVCAQSREIFGVEGLVGSHGAVLRGPCAGSSHARYWAAVAGRCEWHGRIVQDDRRWCGP
jgi:hypothetical protein